MNIFNYFNKHCIKYFHPSGNISMPNSIGYHRGMYYKECVDNIKKFKDESIENDLVVVLPNTISYDSENLLKIQGNLADGSSISKVECNQFLGKFSDSYGNNYNAQSICIYLKQKNYYIFLNYLINKFNLSNLIYKDVRNNRMYSYKKLNHNIN